MRICTITCHDVYNYGASLQAYALMTSLGRSGHTVEIIDYKPAYLSKHYKLFRISSSRWKKNVITRFVYLLLKLPSRLLSLRRKKVFDEFTKKYLKLTSKRYCSNEELKVSPPSAELYVCGSDQIWNCNFPNGRDPAFYLDFVPARKRKISYAASFAMDALPEDLTDFLRSHIDGLDAISVREESALPLLRSLGILRGEQVVDPVFLLNRDDWEELAMLESKEPYVLVYSFDNEKQITELAKKAAARYGTKIYSVNPCTLECADKNWNCASPTEFLSLIRHAEYVITNSFHAVAFSVIFERVFTVVGREEKLNSRMMSLLQSLGISERYLSSRDMSLNEEENLPYADINLKLGEMVKRSQEFLNANLKEASEKDTVCH